MSVAFVGQATDDDYQAAVTLNYSSTGGNTLILCVHHHGSTTSPTITDSAGNTWQIAADTTSATGNEGRGTMYYCIGASAITSVTIPAQSSVVAANLSEWTGVESFRGASTAYQQFPTSRQVTTSTSAGDFVIGQASVWAQDEEPPTPDAGWTALTSAGSASNWIVAAYDLESAGGDVGPTFTMPTGAGKFGNITAAFVPTNENGSSASTTPVFRIANGELVPMSATIL